jgi:hypothetical protein
LSSIWEKAQQKRQEKRHSWTRQAHKDSSNRRGWKLHRMIRGKTPVLLSFRV